MNLSLLLISGLNIFINNFWFLLNKSNINNRLEKEIIISLILLIK
jgi:hypothetical protein